MVSNRLTQYNIFNAAQRNTAKPNICTYARKILDAQPEMLTTFTNIPLIYRFKIFGRENWEEEATEIFFRRSASAQAFSIWNFNENDNNQNHFAAAMSTMSAWNLVS